MSRLIKQLLLVAPTLLPLAVPAQSTCYTNTQGVTLCSTPAGVINGSTNQVGNSVYRDTSGNRVQFDADQFGNAAVETPDGERVEWSQPIIAEQRDPAGNALEKNRESPPPAADPTP